VWVGFGKLQEVVSSKHIAGNPLIRSHAEEKENITLGKSSLTGGIWRGKRTAREEDGGLERVGSVDFLGLVFRAAARRD